MGIYSFILFILEDLLIQMQGYPQSGGFVVNKSQKKPPISTSFSHSSREIKILSGQTINPPTTLVAQTGPQMSR
jgi:hypothetical protein